MSREELIGKMAWAIRSRKHADACEQAREVLAAIEQADMAIVPTEPTPRIVAATFVQTQDPSTDDLGIARQALTLLPSSPVEKVGEALADISRDYRALIEAGRVK